MLFSNFDLDNTALLLIITVVVLSLLWWLSPTRHPPGLPPSPGPALPLLGHLYLLDKDPRPRFHKWRRQYGDVFSLYMGRRLVVVLCEYDVIKEAFVKMADVFSHRPVMFITEKVGQNMGIICTSGQRWREQRKVALDILKEMGMGTNLLADKIQEEITQYIKALYSFGGQPTDVKRMTHISVSNNICSILFGKRFEYDDPEFTRYLQAMDENFNIAGGTAVLNFMPWLEYLPGDLFNLKKVLANMNFVEDSFIKPQIVHHIDSHHKDGDNSDFIHAYIREMRKQQANGRSATTSLDEKNLLKAVHDLYAAATETTATTIRWALAFFLHNPEVQDKCFDEIQRVIGTERAPSMRDRRELTYVEATIMEILRLGNVAPLSLQHGLERQVKLKGYTIPKNAVLIPFLEAVLHDPKIWEDPKTFSPERFIDPDGKLQKPEELIPFGIGKRICLGESLARMELFLYLTSMIQHFRFLPPEDGHLPSLEGVFGHNCCPEPFLVRAVPRNLD